MCGSDHIGDTCGRVTGELRAYLWSIVADRDGLGLKDQQIFIRHIIFTIVYYHTVITLYILPFPAIQQRFILDSEENKVTQMAESRAA